MARTASRHDLGWREVNTPSTDGDGVAMIRAAGGFLLVLAIVAGLVWLAVEDLVR